MDDLILFMPRKKIHMAKLEDLLEALLKNRQIPQGNVNFLEENCNIWEIPYLSKTKECV